MTIYEEALHDLRELHRGGVSKTGWGGSVRKDDVLRWASINGQSVTATFDKIGIELARDFAAGILTWKFCDWAANDLFGVLTEMYGDESIEVEEPPQFWKFYLAFDHSETVPAEQCEQVTHEGIAGFLSGVRSGPS